jgi:hypothetical protein
LPCAITNILQEFKDIFPAKMSLGLPPLRGIGHQIDLILSTSLCNQAVYKTNPEETKEIQQQVQELLDNEYIRESLSPCTIRVIFCS